VEASPGDDARGPDFDGPMIEPFKSGPRSDVAVETVYTRRVLPGGNVYFLRNA